MAQVGIKAEGFYFPVATFEQAQGPDVRVRDVRFDPLLISAQDCLYEPELVRPVRQPGLKLTNEETVLPISVVEVSGVGPIIKLPGR